MTNDENATEKTCQNIQEIIRQGLESGRLPSLIQSQEGLALIWNSSCEATDLSIFNVYIAHDSILFYIADYPYEYRDAINASNKFASTAAAFGVDVYDWQYQQSIRL